VAEIVKITTSSFISLEPEELFWLSQDYKRRLEWDIFLSEAYIIGDIECPSLGVESYCKSKSGAEMISRYISFKPPTVAAVKMIKGPWYLDSFSGSWNFKKNGIGSTVSFTYNFTIKPRFARKITKRILALLYKAQMRQRLVRFKQWAESNMAATQNI